MATLRATSTTYARLGLLSDRLVETNIGVSVDSLAAPLVQDVRRVGPGSL